MRYAVYVDNPRSPEYDVNFYKTKEEALDAIDGLIGRCEQESADAEKNLHWDITLLGVEGEVVWGPNGLCLVNR